MNHETTIKTFQRMLAYDLWANRKSLQSIRQLSNGRARSIQLVSHIIETQILWMKRIEGDYLHVKSVWSGWDLERCEKEIDEVYAKWQELLKEELLKKRISYKSLNGLGFTNTVEEIIQHVINHSTYHRGQAAVEIRKAGGEPALTDYIVYCREGHHEKI